MKGTGSGVGRVGAEESDEHGPVQERGHGGGVYRAGRGGGGIGTGWRGWVRGRCRMWEVGCEKWDVEFGLAHLVEQALLDGVAGFGVEAGDDALEEVARGVGERVGVLEVVVPLVV